MTSTVLTFPIACSPSPIILPPKPIFPPPGFEIDEKYVPPPTDKINLNQIAISIFGSFDKKRLSSLGRFNCGREFAKPYVYAQFPYSYSPYSRPFFRSHKHRPFNHFRDKNKSHYRKSAYAIAIVTSDFLLKIGAVKIQDGIYIATKNENSSSTQEACAIVGLSKSYAEELLAPNSSIYNILKQCPQLESIAGIEDLSPYRLDILHRTGKTFEDVESSEFVLFNIEPRGEDNRDKLQYPCPNICLPGGGMEPKDNKSWERTLLREFEEEVGIRLQPKDIEIIEQRKSSLSHRNAMYFWLKIK
jgi:NUDIX domain